MRHYNLDDKPHLAIKEKTVAHAGSFTPDLSVARIFRVKAEGNVTIANPVNVFDGAYFYLKIKLLHASSLTVAFGNKFVVPTNTEPKAQNDVRYWQVVYDQDEDKFYAFPQHLPVTSV